MSRNVKVVQNSLELARNALIQSFHRYRLSSPCKTGPCTAVGLEDPTQNLDVTLRSALSLEHKILESQSHLHKLDFLRAYSSCLSRFTNNENIFGLIPSVVCTNALTPSKQ